MRARVDTAELWHQLHAIGNRSAAFVAITLGCLGMVMAYQGCLQIARVTGDYSQVGSQLFPTVISDFAPTLTGMMLATRVGAGIAAELGSMTVTEQVDALRMAGVTPFELLVAPRVIASIAMTVVLSVLGAAAMQAAGGVTARLSFGVDLGVFCDPALVRTRHLALLAIKAAAFGAAIPIVAAACGLRARGGSAGVGRATTGAVIGGSFAVVVLDFAISLAALGLGPP